MLEIKWYLSAVQQITRSHKREMAREKTILGGG
jgi:hypothetical protein